MVKLGLFLLLAVCPLIPLTQRTKGPTAENAVPNDGKPRNEKHTPPLRNREEIERLLSKDSHPEAREPLRIVLVAGPKDHGPGEHDYPAWRKSWGRLLGLAKGVRVDTAENWPSPAQWSQADLVVFYLWNHDWNEARFKEMDAFLARGGGIVVLHAAVIADKNPEELAKRFGLSAQPVRTKYRHGPLDLVVDGERHDPITQGLKTVHLVDETYWPPIGDLKNVRVLATATEEGKAYPMIWAREAGPGRVFCCVPGHYSWTFDDPIFRLFVLRGMAWAAKQPVQRFERLAIEGVKFQDGP